MTKRKFLYYILVLIILICFGVVIYFMFINKQPQTSIQYITTNLNNINWRNYNNKIWGFKFDFPESWLEYQDNSERQITITSCPINACDSISFNLQIVPKYNPPVIPSESIKTKINIGGISADKIVTTINNAILTDIYFQKDGNWYLINLYTSNTNKQQADFIFDHILSSFQFTVKQAIQTPKEYQLFKDIDDWSVIYQDKNIEFMSCLDGNKGNTVLDYVFTMISDGYNDSPGDIDTPYQKIINILKNNGWKQCRHISTDLQNEQATPEVFIKNNKLISISKNYSMGVSNSLVLKIQYDQ